MGRVKSFVLWFVCLVVVTLGGAVCGPVDFSAAYGAEADKGERFITIDFDNVDINLFIKYISELTGKNFIVDPGVKGNVTITSPTRISESDAYEVFESVLEIHGFTTVAIGFGDKDRAVGGGPLQEHRDTAGRGSASTRRTGW